MNDDMSHDIISTNDKCCKLSKLQSCLHIPCPLSTVVLYSSFELKQTATYTRRNVLRALGKVIRTRQLMYQTSVRMEVANTHRLKA